NGYQPDDDCRQKNTFADLHGYIPSSICVHLVVNEENRFRISIETPKFRIRFLRGGSRIRENSGQVFPNSDEFGYLLERPCCIVSVTQALQKSKVRIMAVLRCSLCVVLGIVGVGMTLAQQPSFPPIKNTQNPKDVPPTPLESLKKITVPAGFQV